MKKSLFAKKYGIPKGKMSVFLNQKGFYVVLFLCVLIVAVTGIYVVRTNVEYYSKNNLIDDGAAIYDGSDIGWPEDYDIPEHEAKNPEDFPKTIINELDEPDIKVDEPEIGKAEETKLQKPDVQESQPVIAMQPLKREPDKPAVQSGIQKPVAKPEVEKKVIDRLLPPVSGDIILEFAKDRLVYSKTLEQWCTHNGIDIVNDRGTPVKAAADGIIGKIYHDSQLGITIEIDHGSGLKTIYANLSADNMVKEGQEVKQGTVISGIGNTATFEIGDRPHLHFEVIKDNKNIDPRTLLPN